MIAALLLVALQNSADPSPMPQKFSILADATPPCQRAPGSLDDAGDILVCAPADQLQRLPLRDERGVPDGPTPSNPYLRPEAALDNARPCGASHSCVVGFGGPLVAAAVKGAVGLAREAFAKKPDRSGRVPIDLDDPAPPDLAGKILP